MGWLITKDKYDKVRDTEIKWSIISKSITIIIFVEFIDQLFDYPIKRAILNDKELRCLNTKGKYGKVRDIEIKWSIISKSVTIIIFVEFIDQLIGYPINCASLRKESI